MKQTKTFLLTLGMILGSFSWGLSQCTDLFISEYIEGSSNNKALEIYNPTTSTVNMDDYEIHRFNNGGTSPAIFQMAGSLAPGEVYVIGNASANADILAESDTLGDATFYNGDDAVVLMNTATGDSLDIIGIVGVDPGSSWPVDTGFTNEHTLVRMSSVQSGTKDWAVGATQWMVFPQDYTDSLGAHFMVPCGAVIPSSVSFAASSAFVNEAAGTFTFNVVVANPDTDTVIVDVVLNTGASSATDVVDFTWTDSTLTFLPGSTGPISLTVGIINDTDVEVDETVVLDLMNATTNVGTGTMTLTILDDDGTTPVYDIATVTTNDANVVADSLGVFCELRGIVHGIDLQGSASNILFTVIDTTGGIGVASFGNSFGYTVTEGDSVHIIGTIGQFSGLTQIGPDTVIFISSANTLNVPLVVTTLDESTESEMIRFNNAYMTDPTDWPTTTGSTNIEITNGTDTITVRVDSDTDIDGTPAPLGLFDVIGIGGQFDSSSPFDEGYQLLPRYLQDIIEHPAPNFSLAPTSATVSEGVGTVMFEVKLSENYPDTTSVSVAIGAATTATDGDDYTGWMDTTLTFLPHDTVMMLGVDIVDDAISEADEDIEFLLSGAMGGPGLMDSVMTLTIEDDDYNVYDVVDVEGIDADGLPDSVDVRCELRGIVYGVNLQAPGANIQFTLIDSTGGIGVFGASTYAVQEGDSVHIQGTISDFAGLNQLNIDSVFFFTSGNALVDPLLITELSDDTESELVTTECFKIIDTTQWTGSGSGFNVLITNNVDTIDMRIDREVADLYSAPVPQGWLKITGIGGQFAGFTPPFVGGYQLLPRYAADIVMLPNPNVLFAEADTTVTESIGTIDVRLDQENSNPDMTIVTIEVDTAASTATLGVDFTFTQTTFDIFGCNDENVPVPVTIIADSDVEGNETIVLNITMATNNATIGTISTHTITITESDAIGDLLAKDAIKLYPNPGKNFFDLEGSHQMESVSIINLMGQEVLRQQLNGTTKRLSTAHLAADMYLIQVTTRDGVWRTRWIKE